MYSTYEFRFFYILCLVLIFESFNAIIAYTITDKTFKDFYQFEICSYAGFILIFTLITQYIYELILLSTTFKKNEFDQYFTSEYYSKKLAIFNQVTLFLVINFLFIDFYFYLTQRLPRSSSAVILSIIFCVLSGLFVWNLIQLGVWKTTILLILEFSRKRLSVGYKFDISCISCIFLLLSSSNFFIVIIFQS